jgi:hypothetical protein
MTSVPEKQNQSEVFEKAEKMRFLFIFNLLTSKKCFCGCSLRFGTQLLSVVTIVGFIASIPTLFDPNEDLFIIRSLNSILQLGACLLILISTLNNKFKLAYYGNLIFQISTLLGIVIVFTLGFYLKNLAIHKTINNEANLGPNYFYYYASWICYSFLVLYFALIIFSYTKELGLGHISIIDDQTQLIQNTQQINLNNPNEDKLVTSNLENKPSSKIKYYPPSPSTENKIDSSLANLV